MNRSNALKLALAVALLGGATFLGVRFFRQSDGISEQTFFYDLSEKKLFAAAREALPPIRGLNDAAEDAVRAVVISASADAKDKGSRKIAYLEKYSPEYKQRLEQVRAGRAEPLARGARNALRFVRRVADSQWHPVSTPEGERILTEWNVPGPGGQFPAVCSP